jgi:hypothetical protein
MPIELARVADLDDAIATVDRASGASVVLVDAPTGVHSKDAFVVERFRDRTTVVRIVSTVVEDSADLIRISPKDLTAEYVWRLCIESSRSRSSQHIDLRGSSTSDATTTQPGALELERGALIGIVDDDDRRRPLLALNLGVGLSEISTTGSCVMVDSARFPTAHLTLGCATGETDFRRLCEDARFASPKVSPQIDSYTIPFGRRQVQLPIVTGSTQQSFWNALTADAADRAMSWLCRSFNYSIFACEANLLGRRETGSLDIEERNLISRTLAQYADLVCVAVQPDAIGVKRWMNQLETLKSLRSEAQPIVTIVVERQRSPIARAQLVRTLNELAPRPSTYGFMDSCALGRRNSQRIAGIVSGTLRDTWERRAGSTNSPLAETEPLQRL